MASVGTNSYQLSQAEANYAASVAAQTGLAPSVVTTWVGRESGWGTTKNGSNYLNIGPGYTYPTVAAAASAAANLINTSSDYAGIRTAAATGNPSAQIDAIQASPWDAGHYGGTLSSDYTAVVAAAGNPPTAVLTSSSWWSKIGAAVAPGLAAGLSASGAGSAISSVGNVLNPASWERILLIVVFVGAGLGLVALGLSRLFPGLSHIASNLPVPLPV